MIENENLNNELKFDFWNKKIKKEKLSDSILDAAAYGMGHIVIGFALLALFIGYFNVNTLNATGLLWKHVVYDGVIIGSLVWLCLKSLKIAFKLFGKQST